MKIALFTDTYLPNINGVVTSVELTRKKLEELGHEVYVVCSYPGLLHIKQDGRIIRMPGVELKKLYGYSLAQPLHPLLMEKFRKMKLDIIHCHTEFGVGLFGTYIAKLFHIPLVRTYHTTYEDYTHYINPFDWERIDNSLKKAIGSFSKLYGNDCDRLISPSEKTKELLLSYNIKTPIDVIPTGIDLNRFFNHLLDDSIHIQARKEMHIEKDYTTFLYVGRIAKEKSIEILLDAFKKVKENNLKARLCIIGKGPQAEEIENIIKENKLEDTILFLGSKENTIIPAYYQNADCFLSASTSETQGLTYIESLASSLIVLGRYDRVVMDLIEEGKNGYLFDDENELFEKIKTILSLSDKEKEELSKNAHNTSKIYDANIFAQKMLETYQNAIKEKK